MSTPSPGITRGGLEAAAVNILLLIALATFVVGLWAPLLTLVKLYWITNTFSILSAIAQLAQEGEYLLCGIITFFSVVFPGLKLVLLFYVWNSAAPPAKTLNWLSATSKWSMLDVFLVAVLVGSVKLGAIATVQVHYGLYVFTAAVVLIMLVSYWIMRRRG